MSGKGDWKQKDRLKRMDKAEMMILDMFFESVKNGIIPIKNINEDFETVSCKLSDKLNLRLRLITDDYMKVLSKSRNLFYINKTENSKTIKPSTKTLEDILNILKGEKDIDPKTINRLEQHLGIKPKIEQKESKKKPKTRLEQVTSKETLEAKEKLQRSKY